MQTTLPDGSTVPAAGPLPFSRVAGCLLGSAVGDALGAPITKRSWAEIAHTYGPEGVKDYVYWPVAGRKGGASDLTQMTLYGVEALMGALILSKGKPGGIPIGFFHAYRRWMRTQGQQSVASTPAPDKVGWLWQVPDLRASREPGNTVLAALKQPQSHPDMGTTTHLINASDLCGGVMRIAPVGFWPYDHGPQVDPFWLGAEVAAITHGHPAGHLSAGFFAYLLSRLLRGYSMSAAIASARKRLAMCGPASAPVAKAVEAAQHAASGASQPGPALIEQFGSGLHAQGAVAIALYCAMVAQDFEHGVRLAINHSGASKVTGALTGSLLGMLYGNAAIPGRWLDDLELRTVTEQLAADVFGSVKGWHWPYAYPTN